MPRELHISSASSPYFDGRSRAHVIVADAPSGIGRATAGLPAGRGAHVIVGDRAPRGEEVVEPIGAAGGRADFVAGDLRHAVAADVIGSVAVRAGFVPPPLNLRRTRSLG
jgi:NAD(P)-dependent dehydrogenase (short-subunit alcohol dehydrogenase family)